MTQGGRDEHLRQEAGDQLDERVVERRMGVLLALEPEDDRP